MLPNSIRNLPLLGVEKFSTLVIDKPRLTDKPRDSNGGGTCGGNQVILYNDNHNTFEYVVQCLIKVFNHSQSVAEKITNEAHNKGRAIAEVEEAEQAQAHAQQLCSAGLRAAVEGF